MARVSDMVGRLRQRITFERDESDSKDGFGQPIEKWVEVTTVWAAVEPLAGREFWNAAQVQANVTHRIVIRYDGAVTLTSDMRAKMVDRVFHLSTPPRNLDERGEWWEMLAVEVVRNLRT